ncbi:DUF3800 domain-containing protein [Natronoflexus pectinivorans]|uniref:Uncharacterized protein DUF3800 n=1 Tax=Natronoflexus pectinivorans TaxID=682526 RepID=A0A4R2GFY8_9BACT|nr:DUF3800 domain-containing protein [Natronoflexus pectinivorans]TCO06963.1 uncharacterized protein DUF3800 [Natronoflexus pectinivorans]
MAKEYIIYCDESIAKGDYYSDFYGGCIVETTDAERINNALLQIKRELGFSTELKWTKVTEHHLDKYLDILSCFFRYIAEGTVKVRIMFRQNAFEPVGLTAKQKESGYFLLYYQFIKHAFGLRYCNPEGEEIYIRTYFDDLPENNEKKELFKNHIYALQSLPDFTNANIRIRRRDIVDVDSKNHIILQCVDIILGAMAFRLNNLHKAKPEGAVRRGKRTIVKERLYKYILAEICKIKPNFNVGITTGIQSNPSNTWSYPYRH